MNTSGAKVAAAFIGLLLLAWLPVRGVSAPPPHAPSQRPTPPRRLLLGAAVYTIELVPKVPPAGEVSASARSLSRIFVRIRRVRVFIGGG